MARKNRSLASFEEVANSDNDNINDDVNNNNNLNENNNINYSINDKDVVSNNVSDDDYIDNIINGEKTKKKKPVLTGVYLDPEIAKILNDLGKKAGKGGGGKSRIANEALKKVFQEKGLL